MARLCWLILCIASANGLAYGQRIHVVDGEGTGVSRFEVMFHTAEGGYSRWEVGGNGSCQLRFASFGRSAVIDLFVRAKGYATSVRRFEGESREALLRNRATVTLEEGREISLRLTGPADSPPPQDFLPQIYPPQMAERVQMMWQSENLERSQPDFNFFNVQRVGPGEFTFRVPEEPQEFYVAFQHEGWLRFYKRGPFSSAGIVDDTLAMQVPEASAIEVRLDTGSIDESDLPFEKVSCHVFWKPDTSGSIYSATDTTAVLEQGRFRIADLGPGTYLVRLISEPKEGVQQIAGTELDPDRFFASHIIEAVAGETTHVVVPFVPFDPDAWKGAAHARLRVAFPSGEPAVGKKVTVSWFDGHYGSHTLFDEALPEDGVVELRGVSWEAQADLQFGPYQVSLDNETLGFFRLERTEELQEFALDAMPGAGDMAPGFLFVNVETHEEHGVADFRGRVVVLEFWATWCGPCHPAMEKLLEMAAVHERDWKDRVVVLPISTDHRIDRVKAHIESRGWDTIPHYWSSREADEYFSSAEKKYAVYGIPQAILIDQEGRIAWRGDPSRSTDGPDLAERIQELLEP